MPTIAGVITSSGGASDGNTWDVVVMVSPWRHPDGTLVATELRVSMLAGTSAALSRLMKRFANGVTVRITAHAVSRTKGYKWWHAERVTAIVVTTSDVGLADASAARATPVVVRDAVLGKLVLDRSYDALVTTRRLAGRRYELAIEYSEDIEPQRRVEAARAAVVRIERAYGRLLDGVVDRFLKLYNKSWREDDQRELTRDSFVRKLKLGSVHVGLRGDATVHIQSGELFSDHVIELRLGTRANLREALIA